MTPKTKIIHCSVWGDIKLSPLAIQVIDTIHFQRLHYIRQTGFAYKVFPGATTTRFAHSLGVYYVVGQWLKNILENQRDFLDDHVQSIDERTIELLQIAGLVHDIGHGPFSHAFDELVSSIFPESKDHETRSEYVFRHLVMNNKVALTEREVDTVIGFIHGKDNGHWWDMLVNNPFSGIDADKIDYLVRDSKNLGLSMHFDPFRIMSRSAVKNNKLCFSARVRDDIETLFRMRTIMHKNIYRHHKVVQFQKTWIILMRANDDMIDKLDTHIISNFNIIEFLKWNDLTFSNEFMDIDDMNRFETRNLLRHDIESSLFVDKQYDLQHNILFF
ncbi:MAG: HD domain-containing protein [Flavobacteriia bacterium]|nr:HD domain-containing protein [Flavobacteriia bacterium]